jgi:hypothetical protein
MYAASDLLSILYLLDTCYPNGQHRIRLERVKDIAYFYRRLKQINADYLYERQEQPGEMLQEYDAEWRRRKEKLHTDLCAEIEKRVHEMHEDASTFQKWLEVENERLAEIWADIFRSGKLP